MAKRFFVVSVCAFFFVAQPLVSQAAEPAKAEILETYADIAQAGYEDSLALARALESSVDALIASPSEATLSAARAVWVRARVPYMQTEVFRFGNPIVDDWEGRVNAWPLDESLIDYVDPSYGSDSGGRFRPVNVIASKKITIGGKTVKAQKITPSFLRDILHEAEGKEENVATGYHAIEFLLWGQDLNGTAPGAGTRPATDFDSSRRKCTGDNCKRRAQYLKAASSLLVYDLEEMVENWSEGGAARENLFSSPNAGIAAIIRGMGSLSYGELAGERMRLGLLLHDPEEEHDCFSDNTHNSHYFDQIGIRNVYTGVYRRTDGSVVSGASLADLVRETSEKTNDLMIEALDKTVEAMSELRSRAESVEAYDQMIGEGNLRGNKVVQSAVEALVEQANSIERVAAVLNIGVIEFEGSDSLDNPAAVFH